MFEGPFKSELALARHRDAPLAEERARYIQHCIERGSTPLTIALKCRELLWAARLIEDASPDSHSTSSAYMLLLCDALLVSKAPRRRSGAVREHRAAMAALSGLVGALYRS
jgi:hypothetical protein